MEYAFPWHSEWEEQNGKCLSQLGLHPVSHLCLRCRHLLILLIPLISPLCPDCMREAELWLPFLKHSCNCSFPPQVIAQLWRLKTEWESRPYSLTMWSWTSFLNFLKLLSLQSENKMVGRTHVKAGGKLHNPMQRWVQCYKSVLHYECQ